MTPQVSDFIPGSLVDTDKYVEVDDVNYVTAKQKGKIQIKMCDKNGDPFIETLHNVLLAPDIFEQVVFGYYVNEFQDILVYFTKGFERCNSEIRRKIW